MEKWKHFKLLLLLLLLAAAVNLFFFPFHSVSASLLSHCRKAATIQERKKERIEHMFRAAAAGTRLLAIAAAASSS